MAAVLSFAAFTASCSTSAEYFRPFTATIVMPGMMPAW